MDFQNRAGSKPGSGGLATHAESSLARREQLYKLALEVIDVDKDPYIFKNHLGSYVCRLCQTLHTNVPSYMAHTQGKKHQANLGRRAAYEAAKDGGSAAAAAFAAAGATGIPGINGAVPTSSTVTPAVRKRPAFIPIGRPGYTVTAVRDPKEGNAGFLFKIGYPLIAADITPFHRFMAAYEQKVEVPPDRAYQYLVFAAEPYETIAFKVSSRPIDQHSHHYFTHWDKDTKTFTFQFLYAESVVPAAL